MNPQKIIEKQNFGSSIVDALTFSIHHKKRKVTKTSPNV